jgi:hypothetical protein
MEVHQDNLDSLIKTVQTRQGAKAIYHEAGQEAIVIIDQCHADNWGMYATIKKTATLSSGKDELGEQWQISADWQSFVCHGSEWCASMPGGWRIRFI